MNTTDTVTIFNLFSLPLWRRKYLFQLKHTPNPSLEGNSCCWIYSCVALMIQLFQPTTYNLQPTTFSTYNFLTLQPRINTPSIQSRFTIENYRMISFFQGIQIQLKILPMSNSQNNSIILCRSLN